MTKFFALSVMNCYIINFVKGSRHDIAELSENSSLSRGGSEVPVWLRKFCGEFTRLFPMGEAFSHQGPGHSRRG